MVNPIPDFDHNLVLPPHLGSPTDPNQLSPYPCTTLDLCQKFGTSEERRNILSRFLDFRDRLRQENLTNGFQWLDGSFLEDIEAQAERAPNDLDVVTVYWGYDSDFQNNLGKHFPEFASPSLAKANFLLDHYTVDAGYEPDVVVEYTRYWISLFSHNRLGVWKGMLKIGLNTQAEDAAARLELERQPQ
jgi:hypothetical protein